MGWDVFNYIAGGLCIVGPLFLIGWYFQAAKHRVKKLNEKDS